LSHLVVRPRRFWKIKEKKMKKKINNDLAIVANQYLEGRFMTVGVLSPVHARERQFALKVLSSLGIPFLGILAVLPLVVIKHK